VADLDGDGKPEVIWGAYDVWALNGADGSIKWRAASGNRVWPGVAVADLTGDGTLEVIVGRGGDQLTVYDRNGSVLWTRSPFGSGEIRTLAVEDLESDGRLEIIVGRASGGATLQLSVYEPDGSLRPGWPARRNGEAGYGWGMYNENVAVGDLNGDGLKEVYGPTDTHYITALDGGGNQLPASSIYNGSTGSQGVSQAGVHGATASTPRVRELRSEHRPNFANSAPAIADVDGDGTRELVVVGNVYNCGTDPYTDLYLMPFVFRIDRTRWAGSGYDWTSIPSPGPGSGPLSEDYSVIENNAPNAVLADLDGDGKKEILYASYDGKVHAYWLDKTEHGSWPYTVPGGGIRFASEPIVADLDADGQAEVIFVSWPQKGGTLVGQVHILSSLGVPLQTVSLPASFPSGRYNGGLGAPTLANIDGDADLELLVGTVNSGVVAYDLPNTAGAPIRWGTGRGSYRRTGAAPEPGTSATWGRSDFNGDGRSDILWRHAAGALYVWLMNGLGLLSSGYVSPITSTWEVAGTGDFAATEGTACSGGMSAAFYMWLMNGTTVASQGYTASVTDNTWQVVGLETSTATARTTSCATPAALYVWL
jgi:hypothetical protein